SGLVRGSSGPALQTFLRRHAGIHHAEANYLSDTVVIGYDEAAITEPQIRSLIEECGYHCQGEVVPRHVCAPESDVVAEHLPPALGSEPAVRATEHAGHAGHAMPAEGAPVPGEMAQMAHEMGHGAGMDMEAMVRDMR